MRRDIGLFLCRDGREKEAWMMTNVKREILEAREAGARLALQNYLDAIKGDPA